MTNWGHTALLTLALGGALVCAAASQESAPATGTPSVPDEHGVIDLRAAPEAPLAAEPQQPGEAAPAPPPRPPDSLRPVPAGLRAATLAAAEAPLPLGPSPAITEGFQALPDNNAAIPPDTHGAVGPSHLVVTHNTQVRIQNRDGSLAVADRSLDNFWSAVNGGGGSFDPRTFYDPYADRFVTVACDDARLASSAILIGATRSSDPTGIWDLYRVDVDSGDTLWADFPSVGFNSKWVVVQVNMFTFADAPVRSNIYVFDRSALYLGSATFAPRQDAGGFTQAPALTYDVSEPDLFLVEEWNGGAGALRLSKLSGTVGNPVLSQVGFPIGPAWQATPPAVEHAPQLGSVQRIRTNDARIQNLVFRNGKLWTTHTVFSSTPGPFGRASVQWWQLTTAGGVLQNGRIDDGSGANFYAFPSIAVNKFDDALLGFSCFAATRFASACYAFRKASDAPNTFQDVATLKEGLAAYYKTFGFTNRWGDYSASAVDPVNDVDLWTIQEYAELPVGNDRWGTWWGHLALPPDITIDDVSLAEGNSGNTNARFTISLSFPSTQTVRVDWAANDGTALVADSDFLIAFGQAVFAPGTTTQFVDVPVVGDLKLETNETFTVDLSNPVFGVVADAQGLGTIVNDDPVPRMSIDDVRVVEGNTGSTNAVFTVTLSNPSAFPASASWSTTNGTATGADYTPASGPVSFVPGDTSETLSVMVSGDFAPEANETFRVDLSAPAGAVLGESRGIGTILDDDGPGNPDVTAFTIVSDGAAAPTSGKNRLQWVNPVGGSPIELRIRYNKGNGCTPPDPAFPDTAAFGLITPPLGGLPGEPRFHDHTGLDLDISYCYTFWVIHSGSVASAGVSGAGRPFDATGNLKWKYATGTGTTGVAPPTVGPDGILAVDNSGDVHAMRRSATGGPWLGGPPLWNPLDLGSPSQARNPIIPRLSGSRYFVSTQDGRVHSVDATSGALHWSSLLSPAPAGGVGAPAAIFTAFGGEHDAVFQGTSAADDNRLHALDPATGAVVTSFGFPGEPGIGPIMGMAVVDYSRNPENRVYFASRRGTAPETLWCVELGPAGPVGFTLLWKMDVGEISGSPVLRNGRIYVGTDSGEVKSVDADLGPLGVTRTAVLGDGPVRDFVFPDRGSADLYASTNGKVWRLTDPGSGPSLTIQWPSGVSVTSPSVPVLRPGASHIYVGGGDGKLHEIALPGGARKELPLDYDPNTFAVGAPSFDGGFVLVHVGSTRGTFYAVSVPLP